MSKQLNTDRQQRVGWVVGLASGFLLCSSLLRAQQPPAPASTLPPFGAVQQAIEKPFAERRDWKTNDLICRSDVEQTLKDLERLGWKIPSEDAEKLLRRLLPDSHVMVTTFRTAAGQRFMRQISGREMMYDRLDRISEVSGGPRLIQDIVKLPNGEKYAKPMSGGGVPDLLDLLPKGANGQTRKIQDYDKRTGRVYTVADLVAAVRTLYRQAEKEAGRAETSGKARN